MAETVNQETTAANGAAQTPPENAAGRTFTQAELDAILTDRLARERAKYPDYEALKAKAAKYDEAEEASKSELQKAQDRAEKEKARADSLQAQIDMANARSKVAAETGVPASLLTGVTEEECKKQAEALKEWRGPAGYPDTHDPGAGVPAGGGKTRDQFAAWFEKSLIT